MKRFFAVVVLLGSAGVSYAHAQTRMIAGRVTDSLRSTPIPGGLIRVLGTPIQAQVHPDGTFIVYVPVREVTLGFELKGYKKKEVRVAGQDETVVIPVRRDFFELSEVVIEGTATGVERKNLPHSVSSVSG